MEQTLAYFISAGFPVVRYWFFAGRANFHVFLPIELKYEIYNLLFAFYHIKKDLSIGGVDFFPIII
jgi:hypothetical protein